MVQAAIWLLVSLIRTTPYNTPLLTASHSGCGLLCQVAQLMKD